MDAKDFIRDFYRMCEGTDDCSQCGLEETSCDITNRPATDAEIEKTIKVVEEWGKTHPIKTNKSVVLILLPNDAMCDENDNEFVSIIIPLSWWKNKFKGVEYD